VWCMAETDYIGVDALEYRDVVKETNKVVLALSHEHHGRLRFPLEADTAEQLAGDVDGAVEQLEDDGA